MSSEKQEDHCGQALILQNVPNPGTHRRSTVTFRVFVFFPFTLQSICTYKSKNVTVIAAKNPSLQIP